MKVDVSPKTKTYQMKMCLGVGFGPSCLLFLLYKQASGHPWLHCPLKHSYTSLRKGEEEKEEKEFKKMMG